MAKFGLTLYEFPFHEQTLLPSGAKEMIQMIQKTIGTFRDVISGNISNAFIYDVGVSVGAGGYNHQEDTMLVQYFLMWIGVKTVEKNALGLATLAQLQMDGIVGPMTLQAIRTYQGYRAGLTVDGRVDPGESTIMQLNVDFFFEYPNVDPSGPLTWPPYPPLLAAALARVAAQ